MMRHFLAWLVWILIVAYCLVDLGWLPFGNTSLNKNLLAVAIILSSLLHFVFRLFWMRPFGQKSYGVVMVNYLNNDTHGHAFEERVLLVCANNKDDAIEIAERENAANVKVLNGTYTGFVLTYECEELVRGKVLEVADSIDLDSESVELYLDKRYGKRAGEAWKQAIDRVRCEYSPTRPEQ